MVFKRKAFQIRSLAATSKFISDGKNKRKIINSYNIKQIEKSVKGVEKFSYKIFLRSHLGQNVDVFTIIKMF